MTGSMEEGRVQERPFTVSSLAAGLKSRIEGAFSRIFVEGEISGWRRYPSGHAYFTVKDAGAQLQAVMFKSSLERCRAAAGLKDGAKVVLYATATLYPQRGSCQLNVLAARLTGEGDLMQRYMELKERLGREGLFAPERKRPLPFLPRRIGLVTSIAGAVVHDMCRVLVRRFPNVEIRVFPAAVQGADAARSVVAGLGYFNSADGWRADLLIVARGGGSFEDLFPFNDEALVRAVAASAIPVISAVGHETDFTLCDFAADARAGTPSIAAETAVPEKRELAMRLARAASSLASSLRGRYQSFAQTVDSHGSRMRSAVAFSLSAAESRLNGLKARLVPAAALRSRLDSLAQKTAALDSRLVASLRLAAAGGEARTRELSARLELLSPFSVLERGYSLTTDASGAVLKDASAVKPGDALFTRLASGTVESRAV